MATREQQLQQIGASLQQAQQTASEVQAGIDRLRARQTQTTEPVNFQEPTKMEDMTPTIPQIDQPPAQEQITPPNFAEQGFQDIITQQERVADEASFALDQRDREAVAMSNLFGDLAGRTAFQEEQLRDLVDPEQKILKQYRDEARALEAEMSMNDISLAAGLQQIEDQAIPMEFITGQQLSVQRQADIKRAFNNAKLNMINAKVMAQQGNVALARDSVDRAVNIKYGPVEEEIQIRKARIEALEPYFDRAERKEAKALDRKYNLQLSRIEDAKRTQRENAQSAIALSGTASQNQQGKLAEAFALLDPASETFAEDRAALIGQLKDPSFELDMAIKRNTLSAQNAAARARQVAAQKGYLTQEQLKQATDLRKEVNSLNEVKNAKNLEGDLTALLKALNQEEGVGDIAAINSFQRLAVDPGVAVREGDVTLLQSAQSYGDRAWLKAQGLLVGDKLTPEARQQMRELSRDIYDARVGYVEDNTAPMRQTAEEMGIDYDTYVGRTFSNSEDISERVYVDTLTPDAAAAYWRMKTNEMLGENTGDDLLPGNVTR